MWMTTRVKKESAVSMSTSGKEKNGMDDHKDEKKKARPGGVEKRAVWMTTLRENHKKPPKSTQE